MPAPALDPIGPLLPYGSGDRPGCGGRLKALPEDFVVDELSLYEPAGSGEHLYLWVEKRGLPTAAVTDRLRRALGVPAAAIGTAGQKDAQAVARQWISVHTPADPDPTSLCGEGWRVLAASRHGNKLRPGHLRGNRFAIAVRGVTTDAAARSATEANLRHIGSHGFPNYFGPQRLGSGNANALEGRRIVAARKAHRPPRRYLERTRFAVNAYQAALFNALTARRLTELGDLETLLLGDLALLHRNGAVFSVRAAELAATQARAAGSDPELSPSAPLFGHKTPLAEGRPGAWERELLTREGLAPDAFRLATQRLSPKGERRAVRAFAQDLAWAWDDTGPEPLLRLEFGLPPGCYATTLLRELMRNDELGYLPGPDGEPADR